jgi:hypothetical protein
MNNCIFSPTTTTSSSSRNNTPEIITLCISWFMTNIPCHTSLGHQIDNRTPVSTTSLTITCEQPASITGTYTKHTHEILHFLKNHSYFKLTCKYRPNIYLMTWHIPTQQCTLSKKAIPLQALTGPEGSKRLRLPDFKTVGTWSWQGCQPYAPAAFTPRKYSWYSFLLEAESTPGP